MIDQEKLLKAIDQMPMMSSSATALLRIVDQPDHNLIDVVNIVKFDATLTAKVLKTANSAAFSPVQPVVSIDRAIAFLGESMVLSIALYESANKIFNKELEGYSATKGDLWKHDLRAAIASKEIAKSAKTPTSKDLAFTAGLLHDIGKSVMSDFLKGTSKSILEAIGSGNHMDYISAENALLGIDHTQVGYMVAKNWKLPEQLQMVILHHHTPEKVASPFRTLTYAVHLGDMIAMMGGVGTGADCMQYTLDSKYINYLDISLEELSNIFIEVEEEFNKVQQSLKFL